MISLLGSTWRQPGAREPDPVRTGKSRVVAKVHHLRMDVAFKPLLERLQVPHCWPSFEYADTSHLDVPQRSESPSWLQDEHLAFIDILRNQINVRFPL